MTFDVSAAPTARPVFPALPFDVWEVTKETLHRYAQILGKIRLGCCAPLNHRWNVTLQLGKQSPVQLFWHSFDLALTRFSGRRAPERGGAYRVPLEAHSHEVVSFGFWPGDSNARAPAFYSYTAPEPEGLTDQPLRSEAASWTPQGGTALLMYDDLRTMDRPQVTLLEFMESAYRAGDKTAGWDVEAFRMGFA